MINLLPRTYKNEVRAAYNNTLLIRYVILLAIALAFLIGALLFSYVSLTTAAKNADATKQENERKAIGYTETQAAITSFRSDLTAAKTLFDDEIRYSKVLLRLSALLPEGSALNSLELTNQAFAQPLTLIVQIKDQAAAEKLQNNFRDSPYISNISLGKITTNNTGAYPYSAELDVTLNRSIGQ